MDIESKMYELNEYSPYTKEKLVSCGVAVPDYLQEQVNKLSDKDKFAFALSDDDGLKEIRIHVY